MVTRRVSALEDEFENLRAQMRNIGTLLKRALGPSSPSSNPGKRSRQDSSLESNVLSLTANRHLASPSSMNALDTFARSQTAAVQPETLDQWVQNLGAEQSALTAEVNSPTDPIDSLFMRKTTPSAPPQDTSALETSFPGPSQQDTSEEEDDFLGAASTAAPAKDVFEEDEAVRLRIEGRWDESFDSTRAGHADRRDHEEDGHKGRQKQSMISRRGNFMGAYPDPILLGLCEENEGKQLFDLFFEGAAVYLPLFDPRFDTWDDLRQRSPFAITAILMVGSIVRGSANQPSDLQVQQRLRDYAERIAMATLFSPVNSIETVQAMLILACWGDTAWRPGIHALSMATGMGRQGSSEDVARDQQLVVGARVWVAVGVARLGRDDTLADCSDFTGIQIHVRVRLGRSTLSIHSRQRGQVVNPNRRMCLNFGRPIPFLKDETVHLARQFLEHPLSIPTDSRFALTLEMYAIRLPLVSISNAELNETLDAKVAQANTELLNWELRWRTYHSAMHFTQEDFLVSEMETIKLYGLLQINATLLYGIRSKQEVLGVSDIRKHWLVTAVRAAETLIARVARGNELANLRFEFITLSVDLGLVVAAKYLICLGAILPCAINQRQAAKDVEVAADRLSKIPGFHFADSLHRVVDRARQRRDLPPPTRAASPGVRETAMSQTADPPAQPSFDIAAVGLQPTPSVPFHDFSGPMFTSFAGISGIPESSENQASWLEPWDGAIDPLFDMITDSWDQEFFFPPSIYDHGQSSS
ncbi:hypothetical protein I302_107218 [Kwoniella bestiolae CBS 10118]|uniref:Transcription factor domain-containing protein n=1 Tax=Kwoniella bestiolae CBS 10118 TaxID=1296100 RepID=A0A1B9FZ76_9TREE|nr:hypothetical protein I302_07047 [Kwoniella bestiolae CBS 10118]OCF24061.1 hypothetical protein I302_07047 [Kwoniella bestiolae CBS 10118]